MLGKKTQTVIDALLEARHHIAKGSSLHQDIMSSYKAKKSTRHTKRQKPQFGETEKKPDQMTEMMELSDLDFKILVIINPIRALMDKVDSRQEQMSNGRREMGLLMTKKRCYRSKVL